MNLAEIRNLREQTWQKAAGILAKAKLEGRTHITNSEDDQFNKLETEVKVYDKMIDHMESLPTSEPILMRPGRHTGGMNNHEPKAPVSRKFRGMFYGGDNAPLHNGGLNSLDDFLSIVHSGRADERLVKCAMVEGIPDLGGFSVPEEFAAFILDNSLENEIIRPRAAIYPMSAISRKAPAFDNSDRSDGLFGGFSGQWLAEGEAGVKQEGKLRLLTLTAKKLACFTQASNELLADGVGFEEQLGNALINALGWFLDHSFINGTGVGQPLGILNDPALITVAKDTDQPDGTITYNNIVSMFARLSPASFNNAIWVANSSTITELLSLTMTIGTGGVHIPVLKEESGKFTLLGKQVIFTEKCPPLGAKGDLILADLSQYAIGIRKEISLDRSNAPGWLQDLSDFRIIARVDGKGMWEKPIVPKNGNTLSWCVCLAARKK